MLIKTLMSATFNLQQITIVKYIFLVEFPSFVLPHSLSDGWIYQQPPMWIISVTSYASGPGVRDATPMTKELELCCLAPSRKRFILPSSPSEQDPQSPPPQTALVHALPSSIFCSGNPFYKARSKYMILHPITSTKFLVNAIYLWSDLRNSFSFEFNG